MVTKLLEKAIEEASKLSREEQDEIAALILDELESETKWDELLGASSNRLRELATEALVERGKGKTKRLNPDQL